MKYFTEIELLKNRINELEEKLQKEREEHREAYGRLKTQLMFYQNSQICSASLCRLQLQDVE
jgi:hypothetical protein